MRNNPHAKLDSSQVQFRRGRPGGRNYYSRFDDMDRKRHLQGENRGADKQNRLAAMQRRMSHKRRF